MYTRPGVEGAVQLVDLLHKCHQNDSEIEEARRIWKDIESKYSQMIFEKGGGKLKVLDEYCNSLSERLREMAKKMGDNKGCFICQEELLKVVQWKFAKGKPRMALMKHLHANSEKEIQAASSRAFSLLQSNTDDGDSKKIDDTIIKNSVNSLCELKGVGPATASAILCLKRPDLFSFMDDEVIECLHDGKRAYTYKVYETVNHSCMELAQKLGNDDDEWTPWRVGRTIWTAAKLHAANKQDFLNMLSNNNLSKTKRKQPTNSKNDVENNTKSQNSRPSRKRRKRN